MTCCASVAALGLIVSLVIFAGFPRSVVAADYLTPKEPRRLALVIGNADYVNFGPLPGSVTDAEKMRDTLQAIGFSVDFFPNVRTFSEFEHLRLVPFISKINEGDLVVFYFSGHGFSHGQHNYLVPTDAPATISRLQLDATFLPEGAIRSLIADRNPGVIIVLLDACRTYAGIVSDEPDPGVVKGLSKPSSLNSDVVIGFAADPGSSAFGLPAGSTSWYTSALTQYLAVDGWELSRIRREVTYKVYADTKDAQRPWFSDSLMSEVFFKPTDKTLQEMRAVWESVLAEGRRAEVEKYLALSRVGPYAHAARQWLKDNPGDTRTTYTQISPLLPELAWAPGASVSLRKFPAGVGVSRTFDISAMAAIPGDLSGASVNQLLAFQGQAMTWANVGAMSDGKAVTLPPGAKLENLEAFDGRIQAAITIPGGGATASIAIKPPSSDEQFFVGHPIAEVSLKPSSEGSWTAVDPAPLVAEMGRIRAAKHQIGWVSISTPKAPSQRVQGMLSLQAIHAKQLLKSAGVAEAKISTVEGLGPYGGGVRVRIYGF